MSATHSHFGGDTQMVSSAIMEETPGYFVWTVDVIKSHLQGHLLEVGCGNGLCTGLLVQAPYVTHVTAIDIDPTSVHAASMRNAALSIDWKVGPFQKLPSNAFDSVLCANVLEHIEDDAEAASALARLVRPSGTVAVLVPAHPFLYTEYDRAAGHFRRYKKRQLQKLLTQSGLHVDQLFFFNALGALGWWISGRHGNVDEKRTRRNLRFFERAVLPPGRIIEHFLPMPFGLSLIALCTRKEPSTTLPA